MLLRFLSYLLFLANRGYRSQRFFQVKDLILSKYGKLIGTHYQFIEGKICFACYGTGTAVDWDGVECGCHRCVGGWFKQPRWVQLQHYHFGGFTFHKPNGVFFEKPTDDVVLFNGRIVKPVFKLTRIAQRVLQLVYEKGYLRRQLAQLGSTYRYGGFNPINNLIHLFRYGLRSTQAAMIKKFININFKLNRQFSPEANSDLPF